MTGIRALTATVLLNTAAGCAAASTPPVAIATTAATGFEDAAARYRNALGTLCVTGVTAEVQQRYEAAVHAADDARYGGGRQSNFWGPRNPEAAYHDCFQSPGFF
jgi:hypothetical protein